MRRTKVLLVGLIVVMATIGSSGIVGATTQGPTVAQMDDVDCSFPVTATDATGTEVTIPEAPDRIVTLGPSAAQTMWEIGASDEVVGVTKYAAYLDGAAAKENISGASSYAELESVVALDPDLVLAPNIVQESTVSKLRDAGLTVFKFEAAATMADIAHKTKRIGSLTGNCEGAEQRATEMNETLAEIDAAVEGEEPVSALYYMHGSMTAGSETFIDHVIQTAGATNVGATADIRFYEVISDEVVLNQDPEWILRSSDQVTLPNTTAYEQSTAAQEGQILVLDPNEVSQPAPRVVEVTDRLAHEFHPEAFEDARTENTTTTTSTETETTPVTTTSTAAPTTSTSAPGMGILVALGAVAIAGLVGYRD